jgi:hypothetical protein
MTFSSTEDRLRACWKKETSAKIQSRGLDINELMFRFFGRNAEAIAEIGFAGIALFEQF